MAARRSSNNKYAFINVPVDPEFAHEFNQFCLKHGGTRARAHIVRVAIRALMARPPKSGLALPLRVLYDGAPARSERGASR